MLRPELCGGADGIAIPQGQQGLVASHQGFGQAKRQRRQQGAQHRQVVAIREFALLNSTTSSAPKRQAASNLPGTLAG